MKKDPAQAGPVMTRPKRRNLHGEPNEDSGFSRMTKEYTLEFLLRDDGSVICVNRNKAVMLNRTLAGYVQRLVEEFQPAERQHAITPPARAAELAKRANGPAAGHDKWHMTKTMVTVLNNVAAFAEPVSIGDVMTLCALNKRGTASSKLSMLTQNGYLTRVDVGKYMVSPEGNAFLLEHAKS